MRYQNKMYILSYQESLIFQQIIWIQKKDEKPITQHMQCNRSLAYVTRSAIDESLFSSISIKYKLLYYKSFPLSIGFSIVQFIFSIHSTLPSLI